MARKGSKCFRVKGYSRKSGKRGGKTVHVKGYRKCV